MKPKRYRLVERVVFEYVWDVEAESPAAAKQWCREHGDGEATSHDETSRKFIECEEVE